MTRPQPPTCCCCQRSRGASLSACALNQQSVRTPALHCTREFRSDSGPQLPKGFVPFLGCWLSLQLHVQVQSLWLYSAPYTFIVSQFTMLLQIFDLFSPLTFRLGTPFTSVRMKTQWLSVLSTFAQSTLMTARGCQAHNTHPRGLEVSQMDPQTTKTWYVKAGTNVILQRSLSSD